MRKNSILIFLALFFLSPLFGEESAEVVEGEAFSTTELTFDEIPAEENPERESLSEYTSKPIKLTLGAGFSPGLLTLGAVNAAPLVFAEYYFSDRLSIGLYQTFQIRLAVFGHRLGENLETEYDRRLTQVVGLGYTFWFWGGWNSLYGMFGYDYHSYSERVVNPDYGMDAAFESREWILNYGIIYCGHTKITENWGWKTVFFVPMNASFSDLLPMMYLSTGIELQF